MSDQEVHANCLICEIKNTICTAKDIRVIYPMQIIVYSTLSLYFIYKIYREFYPSQRKK